MDGPCCSTCRWWTPPPLKYPFESSGVIEWDRADCRRHAPIAIKSDAFNDADTTNTDRLEHRAAWPKTRADDFCGDHLDKLA